MIEVMEFKMPDLIPQGELKAWRDRIEKPTGNTPPEVIEFIEAISSKLPDFGKIGEFLTLISGRDLQLAGMKEFNGEKIDRYTLYSMKVPHMVACDNKASMLRLYHKKGKQGLIDFCKAKVNGSELWKVLQVLNVHVFKQDRAEYLEVLKKINASKKLEVAEELRIAA